jgi:hypothetical protein
VPLDAAQPARPFLSRGARFAAPLAIVRGRYAANYAK